MRSRQAPNALRAGAIAAALLLLTLIAHAAAEGDIPGALGLTLAGTLAVAFALPAATKTFSVSRLFAFFLGGQFLLHAVLAFSGGHGNHATWLPDASMAASHALAAVLVTAIALHFDRALAVARRMRAILLGAVFEPAIPFLEVKRSAVYRWVPSNISFLVRASHLWRGPPAFAR